MQSCRLLQGLLRSTVVASSPAWLRFCSPATAAVGSEDSSSPEDGQPATAEQKKRGPYKLTELISELDDFGSGRRFKRSHWEEGSFWHVVDARVVGDEETVRIKRVSGVRFRNNEPKTGRVSRIRAAGIRGWVPLESS